MNDRRYTKDHEWIELQGDTGVVGITDYAQEQLGDVVFVELPDVGQNLTKSNELGVVESVKAAAEIYAPASGKVLETNRELATNPSLVNESADGDGWFIKMHITDKDELNDLMDEVAYSAYTLGLE
jgi:glycine cleavage system H protein